MASNIPLTTVSILFKWSDDFTILKIDCMVALITGIWYWFANYWGIKFCTSNIWIKVCHDVIHWEILIRGNIVRQKWGKSVHRILHAPQNTTRVFALEDTAEICMFWPIFDYWPLQPLWSSWQQHWFRTDNCLHNLSNDQLLIVIGSGPLRSHNSSIIPTQCYCEIILTLAGKWIRILGRRWGISLGSRSWGGPFMGGRGDSPWKETQRERREAARAPPAEARETRQQAACSCLPTPPAIVSCQAVLTPPSLPLHLWHIHYMYIGCIARLHLMYYFNLILWLCLCSWDFVVLKSGNFLPRVGLKPLRTDIHWVLNSW